MKIGIESGGYLPLFGVAEGLRKMKSHGYDCMDYQGFMNTDGELYHSGERHFADTLLALRGHAEDTGIEISQVHAPWRYPVPDATCTQRGERFGYMAQAIRGTALLGCRRFVVHYIMPFGDEDDDPQRVLDINFDFFSRLLEIAEENEVVLCLENMPFPHQALSRPADLLRFVKRFDSPWMRVCLDTGHAAILGESPAAAARLLGREYLAAMHIHDNDGRIDLHLLPGDGIIDWADYALALKEIGFEGTVSLETSAKRNHSSDLERDQIALFERVRKIFR